MLNTVAFTLQTQGDEDKALAFKAPRLMTLLGVDKGITKKDGTITAHTIDVNSGDDARLTAECSGVADDAVYSWRSTHLGGDDAPVELDKDDTVTIDVNQSGAGKATLAVVLYFMFGEV